MPIRVLSALRAHARLVLCALFGIGLAALSDASWGTGVRTILGWDTGALTYLGATFLMMRGADARDRRARALQMDDGAWVVLTLTVGAAIASVAATMAVLTRTADVHATTFPHGALAGGTLLVSWTLVHTVFALHYAHEFELARHEHPGNPAAGGLMFPTDEDPDYLDFMYFAFVLGVAAQTSDVAVRSRSMRHLVMAHGIIAFWFNTAILALAVNAAVGH